MHYKLFLVGAAIALASTTYSQPKDSTQTAMLDEVTITANKIPQKQSKTGKVVTVINKELIAKSQGKTLGQLLNEQAGITINGALNNMGTNQGVYMRGANIGRTLILVDGVPAYDPSFINNETDLNFFSLGNIDRIEIARGAQSTLYGSDAVAGVINIITARPESNRPLQANAGATYGSFNTFRGHLQLSGQAGSTDYSVRYAKLASKGFSSAFDQSGNANFEKDGYHGDAIMASVNIKAHAKWQIKPYLQYSQYKTDIDNSAFTDDKDFTNNNKNLLAGTRVQYKTDKWMLVAHYMYGENTRQYLDDSTDVPAFVKYMTNDFFGKSQFAELYVNVPLNKQLQLLAGTDFRFARMNSKYFSISSFGPFEENFPDTSLSMGSVYASLLYHLKGFHAEGGVRWNKHQRYGSNATFTFNPSYAINEKYRVFGSIASGFKAPSIFQLYSAYGNKELKAEKSINFEAGLQYTKGNSSHRLVYFYRDIKTGLDFDNNQFQYFNINRQKVHGLEVETNMTLAKKIQLTFNYTFLIPAEEMQSRITFKDTTYHYLLRRPRHQLQATAGWQVLPKLLVSATGKYLSRRYDASGYQQPDTPLSAYFLLGAYIEYKLPRTGRIFVDGQNLTNRQFFDLRGFTSIARMINIGFSVSL